MRKNIKQPLESRLHFNKMIYMLLEKRTAEKLYSRIGGYGLSTIGSRFQRDLEFLFDILFDFSIHPLSSLCEYFPLSL